MRLHRFYVLQPLGEVVVIDDASTIKQWAKVFRYKKTDLVILFNGEGLDVTYSITSISFKECILTRKDSLPSYIPNKKVSLYCSIIKKDLFEFVVQKASELGITTIVPVIGARALHKNLNLERLKMIAVESAEQCGRGDIPDISETILLSQALESIPKDDTVVVLTIDGIPYKDLVLQKKIRTSGIVHLFIGPEGGWSEEEMTVFKDNSLTFVSLGNTVLRAETAAIIASFFALQ